MSARDITPFGDFQLKPSRLKTGANPHSPGSAERIGFDLTRHGYTPELPQTLVDDARRQVAAHATDAADARRLLDILGIGATP